MTIEMAQIIVADVVERMAQKRKEDGRTMADVAKDIGISMQGYAHMEQLEHEPKASSFIAALDELGYTVIIKRKAAGEGIM